MGLISNYKKKRIAVWWRKKFRKKEPEMGDIQKRGFDILTKLLSSSETELTITPRFNKRFIRNKDIFITLERGNLNVINGVYYYDIYLSDKMYEHFASKFDDKLSRRIVKYEAEIKERVKSSLTNILADIDKK